MCMVLKCVCVLALLEIVTCTKIVRILDNLSVDSGGKLFIRSDHLRSAGIFTVFLRNLLDLLPKIPGKKLVKYCNVLAEELNRFKNKYTMKLAKHLRYLSRMYRDELQGEIATYYQHLSDLAPPEQSFLQAMNQVFTLQHAVRFNDYIDAIKDYANTYKLHIHTETRSILEMIVDAVNNMGKRTARDIEKKLRKAVKEYRKEDFLAFGLLNKEPLVRLT